MSGPADRRWRQAPCDPSLRIGDAERNAAAEALSVHYSAGRIDDAELKERLDRAMRAKTGADLTGLMTDLPPLDPAPPPPLPQRPRRRRNGLLVVLAVILFLGAFPHGPMWWWPWGVAFRVPWLLVVGVGYLVWRRARRRRWEAGRS